jgi:nucleoside-diphosphate-sugar epimerase
MNANGMRIFITGTSGFVGGALTRRLAQHGAKIDALCRPGSDRSKLNDVAITWHEGDIALPSTLAGIFADVDWIIHAAGRLGEAGLPEAVYQRVNVDGTRNVLDAAYRSGGKPRVLHVSSPGVLGPTARGPATEDAPYAPSNPYERSKAAAEQVALEFAARGLPVVIARPEFMYGPGDRHVLRLFRAIQRGRFFYIDGGQHLCHPTFIDDAVAGMLLCMSRGRPGQVYHLAGPRPVSFRELGETMASALGVRQPRWSLPRWVSMLGARGLEALAQLIGWTPPLTRAAVAFFSEDRAFSWQKAHRELGYTPEHDLSTGLSTSVAWYRQQGWL